MDWKVGFHGFADNREYSKSNRYPQTIFGARISPEVGVVIDSIHRIVGGASYLQEFGSRNFENSLRATLYYQYKNKGLEFNIGAFPRHTYVEDFPLAILSDTINYYQPNVEGMLFRYQNKRFFQQLWIDWNSRQTVTEREQFKVGLSGNFNITPILYFKHYAILWHNAKAMEEFEGDNIRDNGAVSAHLGLNLSKRVWLDSLTVQAGGILNFDRLRYVYDWRFPRGVLAEVYAEKFKVFVRNTFYKGQSLAIPYGDVFYTSKQYNRLDLGWIPFRYKNLEGRFTVAFHFSEGVVDNQQQFILRYTIGNKLSKKAKT
ncbi:hypothetical protein [Sphingobacterium hungaricum]